MNDEPTLQIEIVDAHETTVARESLSLANESRVADALRASTMARAAQLLNDMQAIDHIADSMIGIWGRRVLLDTALKSGDRIELYRAVTADAKSARHARAREQGYRWQGRTRRAAKT
jgi:uncharacterized protein